MYYDIAALDGKNFDIEMFVLNTSGDRKYTQVQMDKAKKILETKFPLPTPFESWTVIQKADNSEVKINLDNYVKKEEYYKLKKELEDIKKVNIELESKIKKIIKEKNENEIYFRSEIESILKNENKTNYNLTRLGSNYTLNKKNDPPNYDVFLKKYNFFKNCFRTIVVVLLIIVIISILCLYYKRKFKTFVSDNEDNVIQLTELIKPEEAFTKLSTDETR